MRAPTASKWSVKNPAEFFESAAVAAPWQHAQHVCCVEEAEETLSLLQTSWRAFARSSSATLPGMLEMLQNEGSVFS